MSYERMPIVGAFYRPPAKLLLEVLAVGTPLLLLAEPDNPADRNAVAVWIKTEDIPSTAYGTLEENLPQFGFDLQGVLNTPSWHLGYIPKNFAVQLKDAFVVVEGQELAGTFGTNPKGEPRFIFPEPVL